MSYYLYSFIRAIETIFWHVTTKVPGVKLLSEWIKELCSHVMVIAALKWFNVYLRQIYRCIWKITGYAFLFIRFLDFIVKDSQRLVISVLGFFDCLVVVAADKNLLTELLVISIWDYLFSWTAPMFKILYIFSRCFAHVISRPYKNRVFLLIFLFLPFHNVYLWTANELGRHNLRRF